MSARATQARLRLPARRRRELDQGARRVSRRVTGRAAFTARLTIDVTPALRGRIKVAAFRRGVTVADMLRDLLAREFPADGEPS